MTANSLTYTISSIIEVAMCIYGKKVRRKVDYAF
jgi:hypothetical protein